MGTSLFSRICHASIPWYLYLVSCIVFCAAEVLVQDYCGVSLGALTVVVLYLLSLFLVKALYYAVTSTAPPPLTFPVDDNTNDFPGDVPDDNTDDAPDDNPNDSIKYALSEQPKWGTISVDYSSAPTHHHPVLIVIAVILLCALSGGICYYMGAKSAAEASYSLGYADGQTVGYVDGVDYGYQNGYDAGAFDGVKAGYDSGYNDGYSVGQADAVAAANAAAAAQKQADAKAAAQKKAAEDAKQKAASDALLNDPNLQSVYDYINKFGSSSIRNYIDK